MLILSIFKKYNVFFALLLLLPLQCVNSATTQKTSSVPSLAPTLLENPSKQQMTPSLQIALNQLKVELFLKKIAKTSTLLDAIFGTLLLAIYVISIITMDDPTEIVIPGGLLNTTYLLLSLLVRLVDYLPERKILSNPQYRKRIKGVFYTDITLVAFLIISLLVLGFKPKLSWGITSIVGICLHFVMMIVRNIIYWKNVPPSKNPKNGNPNKKTPQFQPISEPQQRAPANELPSLQE